MFIDSSFFLMFSLMFSLTRNQLSLTIIEYFLKNTLMFFSMFSLTRSLLSLTVTKNFIEYLSKGSCIYLNTLFPYYYIFFIVLLYLILSLIRRGSNHAV